jgi:hypothetical protein
MRVFIDWIVELMAQHAPVIAHRGVSSAASVIDSLAHQANYRRITT